MTGKLPRGCDNSTDADINPGRTIKVVPKQNQQMLTEKQVVDYYSYRERFLKWLLNMGKNPMKVKGTLSTQSTKAAIGPLHLTGGCGMKNATTGQEKMLQMLTEWGYDVGSSGMNGSRWSGSSRSQGDAGGLSDTQKLRQRIKETSVEEIPESEYTAVLRVRCGILKGEEWDEAWPWLQCEYEEVGRFNPELV